MSGDRSLVVVVVLSWLVMVGVGASLPAEYQGELPPVCQSPSLGGNNDSDGKY